MDDGTLNAEADGSQPPQDELGRIVAQLSRTLGESKSPPRPLGGGITNRNYRARFGGADYVIRVPGKDTSLLEIDRGAELVASRRAAGLGVAPPVAAMLDQPQCIVTDFVPGTAMEAAELRQPDALAEVARALRAIHAPGEPLPVEFDSFRLVETYAETARERGAEVPDAFEAALGSAGAIRAAIAGDPEHAPVPCHNDLLAANFIRGGDGRIWIVDWEYAGMGDRFFDLANFAVNNELGEAEQRLLLGAYFGAGEPDAEARRLASLRLMRFMSDFREAMWGVVQGAVSELDFDFGEYAAKHFERLERTVAEPGFEAWLREARAAR